MTPRPLDNLLSLLSCVQPDGHNSWKALCPLHDDHTPSLRITEADDGKVLMFCPVCNDSQIGPKICNHLAVPIRSLFPDYGHPEKTGHKHHQPKGKKVAEFLYRDADNVPAYRVERFETDAGKTFAQSRPNGNGGWIRNMRGVKLVPYRLPELIAADKSTPVLIPEGEAKSDLLAKWGYIATCNAGGARKWQAAWRTYFRGRRVIILPDNDPVDSVTGKSAGIDHAEKIRDSLADVAESVHILELPGLPPKGDVIDWQADGHTCEELQALIDAISIAPSATPRIAKTGDVRPLEAEDDPHRLGRLFARERFSNPAGIWTLRFWRGDFISWDRGAWRYRTFAELKPMITAFIKTEFDRLNIIAQQDRTSEKDGAPKAKKVTRTLVENVLLAIQSIVVLEDRLTQPCWLADEPPGYSANELLSTQSGLLHLPSVGTDRNCLLPSTPNFFTPTALEYGYDPSARCPEWNKFLDSIWPDDPQSVSMLQEFMGLLLTPDTQYHKLLLIIGPPRSGKGTIGRLAKSMLGAVNVASPILGSLSEQFGLACLIGKSMALVADARLSNRADIVGVVERLLSITGEDPQDIQRKHLTTLTAVRLLVRFVILANELPRLQDAAGALLSRVLLLKTTESFTGREDRGLEKRLLAELPGILNWAIVGWKRLAARGRFEQPASGQELIDDLSELASPITQFVRECCIVGPGCEVSVNDLFDEWKYWCEQNNREHVGTLQTFGRDLRAARPELTMRRSRDGRQRERRYSGIRLRLSSDVDQQELDFGPQWSAGVVIAREAKNLSEDNKTEERVDRSNENRGPSRTDLNPANVASKPDVMVRTDAPKYPPWVQKT